VSEINLPEGWIETSLDSISSDVSYGYTAKSTTDKVGPHLLRITDIQDNQVNWNTVPFCGIEKGKADQYLLKADDLVFARTGATVGKSFLIKGNIPESVFASYLIRVRSVKQIGINYLAHFFNSAAYWNQITEFSSGIGQPNVNGTKLKELNLPLAPLAEQQQIAQKLDELLAQVDTLKTRLDSIPKILKRFRQSVLAAAVSGRLTEEWRGLNKMPIWRQSTLGKEFKCIDGDRGPNYPKKEEYLLEGHCLFLSTKNVRNYGFDFSDVVFIGKDRHEKLRNGTLERGDLVLTTRGTLGYIASYDETVPFDVIRINSGMLILRKMDSTHVNEFFKMLIASPLFQRIIDEQRTGSAQPQLPAKILKEFELQIPSNKEQTEIVRRVEQLFAYADQIEQRVKDAQARVNHLTQSILAKAFRGELTADWRAQNPELISGENSAAALLEKVKTERESTTKPKRKVK
jgi:type I restriction enzyme, S subunit